MLASEAEGGETESQVPPLEVVAVGVMVTLPEHAPVTPTVKLCVPGFSPASFEKFSAALLGACKVQGDCKISVIATLCGAPTAWCVTLSVAVMLIVPL